MLAPQFQTKANSSVDLWINNLICQRGSGFVNFASYFYPVTSRFNGLYTYGAPFSQFIADSSVSGATVPTGIYLNNTFIGTGQSGFFGYNYEKGYAYFTSLVPAGVTISGRYSVKDFNVALTDQTEENLLFETKMSIRPKTNITPTGQANNELSYPVVFIKNNELTNEPFAFGGQELTKISYSFVIFADSKYQIDALESLINDSVRDYIPVFELSEQPYDMYGRIKNAPFNYLTVKTTKPAGGNSSMCIENIQKSRFRDYLYRQVQTINPEVYFSVVTMNVFLQRQPRKTT